MARVVASKCRTALFHVGDGGPFFTTVLTLMVLTFIPGCSGRQEPPHSRELQAVAVTTAVALATNVPIRLHATGHVAPYATVTVRSQVDGMLARVNFHEGDRLRPGDVLFTVDPRPFEISLKQATANLNKDLALQKNAEVERQANARLLRSNIISQENYDESAASAESLEAALAADRAAVEAAELALSFCVIRSPIDGRAGFVQVGQGSVVSSHEMVLVTLNQTQPIYVDIALPEQELPRLRNCMTAEGHLKVEVLLPGQTQAPAFGEVTTIDNVVDTSTRTVRVRAWLPNRDEVLWPGQIVQAVITLKAETRAVVVPSQVVHTEGQGKLVFVVGPEMRVESRFVEVGEPVGGDVTLLGGVRTGEHLVLESHTRLSPGMRVEIQPLGSIAALAAPPGLMTRTQPGPPLSAGSD